MKTNRTNVFRTSMSLTNTKPFHVNGALAFLVWSLWLLYTMPETLDIIKDNWEISVTMVFGSLIAGATSEGGGAIAFPVFTKLLHVNPADARVFSLAIQSVGMSAATLTIVVMRIPVEWRVIRWASLGGLPGIVFGTVVLAPLLPSDLIRMSFTAMVVSFVFPLTIMNWRRRHYNQSMLFFSTKERMIVLVTGFWGGVMSGLVGNGIDIISFSVMVLLFRISEKVATPTSVILMALNALVGIALHIFFIGDFTLTVQNYWLAAVPVVVVGAPLGAVFCSKLESRAIAAFLISLIVIELVSSIWLIPITRIVAEYSVFVFLLFSSMYYLFYRTTYYWPR